MESKLYLYGQTINLETKCKECNGLGIILPEIHSDDIKRDCEECNGTGYLLTINGQELAKFIQHQFSLSALHYIPD